MSSSEVSCLPRISMMILNWNGCADTVECLDSIQRIDYPKDRFEVVVIDNGSTDGSVETVNAVLQGMRSRGITNTRFERMNGNLGAPRAYNEALSRTVFPFDYLLKLDNDVILSEPMFLKELVAIAEREDDVGIIGPMIAVADRPSECAHASGFIDWNWCRPYEGNAALPTDCDFVTGCVALIKRKVLEECDYFLDEDYFVYWDDTDLCVRTKKLGYRVVYWPATAALHKVSRTTGKASRSPFAIYYSFRNRILFGLKYLSGLQRVLWYPKIILLVLPRRLVSAGLRVKWAEVRATLLAAADAFLGRTGKRF